MNSVSSIIANDLSYILTETESLWESLRGQRIFITGGTGFFGCWLLESFLRANEQLALKAKVVVLTRNKLKFSKKYPHLFQNSSLHFYEGDVKNCTFPKGTFSHIIHAATDANAYLNEKDSILIWDTIVQGTKNVFEFARYCGAKKVLLISSGAAYGDQLPNVHTFSESYPCQPKLYDIESTYAVGKCAAEHMGFLYAKQYGLQIKIARCFSFIGPYLPLDAHFAIGNFIRDGLSGGPIIVKGDGTPERSYLYTADLAVWLWTILFRGETARPYNVGSDEIVTIAELARLVSDSFRYKPEVKIMKPPINNLPKERYVPDIKRAQIELNLSQKISLTHAIQLTKNWHCA